MKKRVQIKDVKTKNILTQNQTILLKGGEKDILIESTTTL